MPSIRLPEFAEPDLLFDERETRQILQFFWPEHIVPINALTIENGIRNFAQGLLVAAIDSSYAMGFVQILFDVVVRGRPGFNGLKAMGSKLARRYVAHWWRHTRRQDLENIRIYESVRVTLRNNFQPVIQELIQHAALTPAAAALYAKLRRVPILIPPLLADRSYWA